MEFNDGSYTVNSKSVATTGEREYISSGDRYSIGSLKEDDDVVDAIPSI
jgi:hypothetical protein